MRWVWQERGAAAGVSLLPAAWDTCYPPVPFTALLLTHLELPSIKILNHCSKAQVCLTVEGVSISEDAAADSGGGSRYTCEEWDAIERDPDKLRK